MKHFIEIDDRKETGKNLLSLIKTLSGKASGIDFISSTVEDKELVRLMKTGIKNGMAEKKNVLKNLGLNESGIHTYIFTNFAKRAYVNT